MSIYRVKCPRCGIDVQLVNYGFVSGWQPRSHVSPQGDNCCDDLEDDLRFPDPTNAITIDQCIARLIALEELLQ